MSEFDDFIAETRANAKADLKDLALTAVARLQQCVLPILEDAAQACRRQGIGFRLNLGWLEPAARNREKIEFSCTELVRCDARGTSKYIFGSLLEFTVNAGPVFSGNIMGRALHMGHDPDPPSLVSETEIRAMVKAEIADFVFQKERFLAGQD